MKIHRLVCKCDVCGHEWIPEVENPERCPRRVCRSLEWNHNREERSAIQIGDKISTVIRRQGHSALKLNKKTKAIEKFDPHPGNVETVVLNKKVKAISSRSPKCPRCDTPLRNYGAWWNCETHGNVLPKGKQ